MIFWEKCSLGCLPHWTNNLKYHRFPNFWIFLIMIFMTRKNVWYFTRSSASHYGTTVLAWKWIHGNLKIVFSHFFSQQILQEKFIHLVLSPFYIFWGCNFLYFTELLLIDSENWVMLLRVTSFKFGISYALNIVVHFQYSAWNQ